MAGQDVDDGNADFRWFALFPWRAGDVHQAGFCLDDGVVAGILGVGAGCAVA